MRRHNRNRSFTLRGAALCAALIVAAASASAAPTLTLLHSFAGGAGDGTSPKTGLLIDSGGGASEFGTVFKLPPSGTLTLLHSFAGGAADGAFPEAGLLADKSGNLFGTTALGGASDRGVVFKLTPSGTLTLLHSFAGGAGDGAFPGAGLLADKSGKLYGTTAAGGAPGFGTVFKLSGTGFVTGICQRGLRRGPC